jgi:hypothetical protein
VFAGRRRFFDGLQSFLAVSRAIRTYALNNAPCQTHLVDELVMRDGTRYIWPLNLLQSVLIACFGAAIEVIRVSQGRFYRYLLLFCNVKKGPEYEKI